MKTMIKYFGVTLCLLILVSVLSCGKRTVSECQSKKIELLLEDLFKKKEYFIAREFVPLDENDKKYVNPFDSICYYGYLYSSNLKIPNREFYLHWNNISNPTYPDSIKLRVKNDSTKIDSVAYLIGVNLLDVNADTTMLKVILEYGLGGKVRTTNSFYRGIFSYSFEKENCKWVILDSPRKPD